MRRGLSDHRHFSESDKPSEAPVNLVVPEEGLPHFPPVVCDVMLPALVGTVCLNALLSVLGAWLGYIAFFLPFVVALGAVWRLFHFGWFK